MAGPLKETTLRSTMKKRSGFRVEKAAVTKLAETINAHITQVVDRAGALVEMQGRRTVQLADVKRALSDVETTSATKQPGKATPAEVFSILEGYSLEQLGSLAKQIEQSLKAE